MKTLLLIAVGFCFIYPAVFSKIVHRKETNTLLVPGTVCGVIDIALLSLKRVRFIVFRKLMNS